MRIIAARGWGGYGENGFTGGTELTENERRPNPTALYFFVIFVIFVAKKDFVRLRFFVSPCETVYSVRSVPLTITADGQWWDDRRDVRDAAHDR